jgi:hypothetical protein
VADAQPVRLAVVAQVDPVRHAEKENVGCFRIPALGSML